MPSELYNESNKRNSVHIMGDFEAKQRKFALSLVAAYSDNLDYFHHVLDILGSYTGDGTEALHSLGSTLFQDNPALLEQFFSLYPSARHPEGGLNEDKVGGLNVDKVSGLNVDKVGGLNEDKVGGLNVDEVSGLNVDKVSTQAGLKNIASMKSKLKMSDVSLCSTVTSVSPDMSSPMKLEINGSYLSKDSSDNSSNESMIVKREYKILVHEDIDDEITCGNRNDIKIDSVSKTDKPLRRSSRAVKVPPGGYKNDLPEDVLVKVTQLKPQVDTPEIEDSSDDFEDDNKLGHQSDSADSNLEKSYERKIVKFENDDHSFESENDQSKNLKEHTESVAERTCPKCLKIFKESKYMQRHCKELINCKKIKPTISCPKCQKIFKKLRYLKEHTRFIDCQKTERISCPKCQSQFKAKKYLWEHIRLQKCCPVVKPFQCPKCNKSFRKKGHLMQHKNKNQKCCPVVKPFQCPKCNKSFRKKGHLIQHKNKNVNCHEKMKPSTKLQKCDRLSKPRQFECPKCGRSFINKGHLTQHTKTNKKVKCDEAQNRSKPSITSNSRPEVNILSLIVGEEKERQEIVIEEERNDEAGNERRTERQDKNGMKKCVKLSENEFQCPQCEMVFATIRKLRWHRMKVHDPNPCICPYCSKSFATKETLSRHVCKINPLTPIKCDVCDASFEDALDLSVHLGIVHNRVCCSHCTRNFANPQNLLQHYELVHETSFTCDQCGSSFTKKPHLLDHIRQVHLKMWIFPCLECEKEGVSIGFKRKIYWKNHTEKHHSQIDTEESEACFDQSFREVFLGKMADEEGSKSGALETTWANIREAVWDEEWEKSQVEQSVE